MLQVLRSFCFCIYFLSLLVGNNILWEMSLEISSLMSLEMLLFMRLLEWES